MSKNIVSIHTTIKSALKQLDDLSENLTLFVVDEKGVLVGTLTDGDVRRGLLNDIGINDTVGSVMNRQFRSILLDHIESGLLKQFRSQNILMIPVVDDAGKIVRIVNLNNMRGYIPVDALIMAGGEGMRLRPLTLETPKPLLKVGGKPIIEYNLDRLQSFGVDRFYISVKYMAEKIQAHLGNGHDKGIQINYVHETIPMGTIGALKLIEGIYHDDVLILNSDLLTNIDFENFYSFFKASNADMAVASTEYNVNVPYAVIEIDNDKVQSIKEKPTYTYYSNAGIYLIKKKLIDCIPEGEFYNATDLMDEVIKRGMKLVNYPILGYWLDIGSHTEFEKAQEDIKHIQM